ncbi:MAG: DUF1704 domain-containing protein [Polyangiaceae bacterium]|nr:DUF1704 domain-containing protein [Polyangiaceae bacterium]
MILRPYGSAERRAIDLLEEHSGRLNLLESIRWRKSVETEFFAKGAAVLPKPVYAIDKDEIGKSLRSLVAAHKGLTGTNPLEELLRRSLQSTIDTFRMLLSVGTHGFYELSLTLFGGSKTRFDRDSTNTDLAGHVRRRLAVPSRSENPYPLTSREFIREMEKRLRVEHTDMPIEFVLDDELTAKVIAGAKRVRVREDARFSLAEARSLFVHEIETHCLTAQNGADQTNLRFLRSGGPRTTMTQEGLAVFAELYDRSLSSARLLRIADRVRVVGMAEDGASFLDVYRELVSEGEEPKEAYAITTRVFRGGVLEGGAPFTKDACYLSGLVRVYNHLRGAIDGDPAHSVDALFVGRIALEDADVLPGLFEAGLLDSPLRLPGWVTRREELAAYFAFTSFLSEIDLKS